jgi:hypothetical protein
MGTFLVYPEEEKWPTRSPTQTSQTGFKPLCSSIIPSSVFFPSPFVPFSKVETTAVIIAKLVLGAENQILPSSIGRNRLYTDSFRSFVIQLSLAYLPLLTQLRFSERIS